MIQPIRPIYLTNTLTRKKELLQTLEPGVLKMYSCGPTVYGLIHIGNLRGGLVADMFYRYFKRVGYKVNYVRNYTDVDDKIIKKGKEEGVPADQIAKKYTQEVEKDFAAAGMEEPTFKTTVTDHMPDIIDLTQKIINNKKAYVANDGEVLFEISQFKDYGKLSHKDAEGLETASRIDANPNKKNPLDFTLWKPAKPGEPAWDSPWGKGRPGWHIECSAMSAKVHGDQMDVHHGGEDLIFPHHENEIAQSEAASGRSPFVKIWLHHAMLNISKEKMSKSLGNVFLARDFLTTFGGEMARAVLLGVHYRSLIDFNDELIEQTLSLLTRIYEAKAKALQILSSKAKHVDLRAENFWGEFVLDAQKTKTQIDQAYANDFNVPEALGSVFTLIRKFNRICAEPHGMTSPSGHFGAQAMIDVLEDDIGSVLGIGRKLPEQMLNEIGNIKKDRALKALQNNPKPEVGLLEPTQIESLILERAEAKKIKDFAKADQIRKNLDEGGVVIKDGPTGTTWQYK